MRIARSAPPAIVHVLTVVVALAVIGFALPRVAFAWHSATPSERSEITRAAESADGSRQQTIRVSDIRVSTVGPWAAADVTIYRRGSSYAEQAETDTFLKADGSWIDTASANAPDREIPRSVERDLGLTASSDFGGVYFRIYLLACWFFGLAAIWDVLLQPRHAFRTAGHGKLRWLIIELLGAPLTGIFTWGYYAIRIRPAVVHAGGRPARTGLKAFLGAVAYALTNLERSSGAPPRRTTAFADPHSNRAKRPCYACSRTGKRKCVHHQCNGGRIYVPADAPGGPGSYTCRACGGRGSWPCPSCDGKGWIE